VSLSQVAPACGVHATAGRKPAIRSHIRSALAGPFLAAAVLGLASCRTASLPRLDQVVVTPVVVPEAFVTARDGADNLDSPAVWHGPDWQHWLLVTAKDTDRLLVFDAATGVNLRRVDGGEASEPFGRPNGIAVVDDLVFVVERDRARVQALGLPDFAPLGSFGGDVLERPYGITVLPLDDDRYLLFVTDNYRGFLGANPPDRALGRRVHRFEVTVSGGTLTARHAGAFGETDGPGVVRVAESVLADAAHARLFVAEEEPRQSAVRVYGLDGRYAGRDVPASLFPNQAEGLALAACTDGAGYVVATDQHPERSVFHVFDRATLAYRGAFAGRTVANTDGVALTLHPFGPFARGAFFAVDDDAAVAAFDWGAVLDALGLLGCPR
jgi:3-phytase